MAAVVKCPLRCASGLRWWITQAWCAVCSRPQAYPWSSWSSQTPSLSKKSKLCQPKQRWALLGALKCLCFVTIAKKWNVLKYYCKARSIKFNASHSLKKCKFLFCVCFWSWNVLNNNGIGVTSGVVGILLFRRFKIWLLSAILPATSSSAQPWFFSVRMEAYESTWLTWKIHLSGYSQHCSPAVASAF